MHFVLHVIALIKYIIAQQLIIICWLYKFYFTFALHKFALLRYCNNKKLSVKFKKQYEYVLFNVFRDIICHFYM